MNKLLRSLGLLSAVSLATACQHNPTWEAGVQRSEALAEMAVEQPQAEQQPVVETVLEPEPLTRIWVFPIGGVGAVGDTDLERQLGGLLADLGQWQHIERIEVVGHTDDLGTEEYNQRLSVQRADRVAERLIMAGIDEQLIGHSGCGELQPVADNATEQGRSENRRVEIRVTGLATWPEDTELALLPADD